MAINYELINQGSMSVGGGFTLLSKNPLDARLVIPGLEGLQNLIDNGAAYAGMVTYISSEKRLYEVYDDNGVLKYKTHAYTQDELKALIGEQTTAAMEFKGATASLPTDGVKGDMYKVSGAFEVSAEADAQGAGFTAKVGDSIVYDGEKWYLIPSGDDIEDTWRTVTGVDNDAALTFSNGDKITASVATDGNIKFNHDKLTAAPEDIATEEDRKTRTYLTSVEVDEYGHVTNYKTATENVEDTDTTYEFECQVEHSNVHFSVKASDAEQAQEVCVDAYTRNETDEAIKVVADDLAEYVEAHAEDYDNDAIDAIVEDIYRDVDTAIADYVTSGFEVEKGQISVTQYSEGWINEQVRIETSGVSAYYNPNGEELTTKYGVHKIVDECADSDLSYSREYVFPAKSGTFALTSDVEAAETAAKTAASEALAAARLEITQEITDATGSLGSMSIKDANDYYTKTEADAAIKVETDRATGVENGLADRIKDIEDNTAGYTTIDEVVEHLGAEGVVVKRGGITIGDPDELGHEVYLTSTSLGFTEEVSQTYVDYDMEGIHRSREEEGQEYDYRLLFPNASGTFALTSDIEAAVNAIDTGVTKVVAGTDIVVTPEAGTGEVTVAHKAFATGEYTKDPATSDKTGDVYMMTSVTVDNGHVTGANVKSLADALMGMTFIFDGGSSTTVIE